MQEIQKYFSSQGDIFLANLEKFISQFEFIQKRKTSDCEFFKKNFAIVQESLELMADKLFNEYQIIDTNNFKSQSDQVEPCGENFEKKMFKNQEKCDSPEAEVSYKAVKALKKKKKNKRKQGDDEILFLDNLPKYDDP